MKLFVQIYNVEPLFWKLKNVKDTYGMLVTYLFGFGHLAFDIIISDAPDRDFSCPAGPDRNRNFEALSDRNRTGTGHLRIQAIIVKM